MSLYDVMRVSRAIVGGTIEKSMTELRAALLLLSGCFDKSIWVF